MSAKAMKALADVSLSMGVALFLITVRKDQWVGTVYHTFCY